MNELQRNTDFPRFDRPEVAAEQPMTPHDLGRVLRRHLWLVLLILAVSVLSAAMISRRTPKAWQATAELLLVQRAPIVATTSQGAADSPMLESIDTQISLLQSRALAQTAAQRVGISTDTLQNAASIFPKKEGDNVIDLSVDADSREHAVAWADALCQAFVQYKKQVAQHTGQERLTRLETDAAKAKQQMDRANAQLLAFEDTHQVSGIGVLDVTAQRTAALNAYTAQSAVVAGLRNEDSTAQARASSLYAQLQQANRSIRSGSGVRDDSAVTQLQDTLRGLKTKRLEIAQRYKPNFPGLGNQPSLASLDAQIAAAQAQLDQAIRAVGNQPSLEAQGKLRDDFDSARTDALTARAKLNTAIQQLGELQRETANLPEISQQADILQQNADQARARFTSLNGAVQTAQLDTDAASGNVQIVQPAYAPPDPFRPSRKRDLLVGAAVGLFLSLVAVLLLEQADRSVRTAADVRRLAAGPVVAVLPELTRAQRSRLTDGDTPPQLVETYNAARANLSLALRHEPGLGLDDHQVILVTSTVAGEGKSLTASELAQSFARAGRRVVLVNADMRRDSSTPLLRPEKGTPGLANVLTGKVAVGDALTRTDVHNLSVLHRGGSSLNPTDLISQPQMAETLRTLRELADVVVIDSPPAAVVADAILLAPHADCVLYVVAAGMVDSDGVRETSQALAAAAPRLLAYFVNRAPHSANMARSYSDYHRAEPIAAPNGAAPEPGSRTMVLEPYRPSPRPADAPAMPLPSGANGVGTNGVGANGVGANGNNGPGSDVGPLLEGGDLSGEALDERSVNKTGAFTRVRVLPQIGTHLVALDGPYSGQKFALTPGRTLTLGILPDSDIVLGRDGTISRRHARLSHEADGYVVYDDGSTNGTYVNDIQITRQPLLVGDTVQFGASKFRYE